jgi:EAL domain-containing protein (putative c-di-GMP-specific phosphodiesterase class I)
MALEDPSVAVDRQESIADILANHSFVSVFQPIVDIATGLVVGYEALSRFEDRRPPAIVFAKAREAGLDLELELVTMRAAVVAARRLPGGRWLDVNVSRRAIDDPRLAAAVGIADRRIILELDAAALPAGDAAIGERIRSFGGHAGLAIVVSDPDQPVVAGLKPQLVKLTRELAIRATGEPEAGWLIGLAGRTASTPLVAEGVETAEEARALARLGIELGQGHHFGSPALASLRPSAIN